MNQKVVKDGHIHSPICPHGSKDSYEMYIEKALKIGLNEITFTEHLPLPNDFMNKEMREFCSPKKQAIKHYLIDLKKLQQKYSTKLKINIGFEVDYLEGYEEFTKTLLNEYGCEDGLLAIHFLKIKGEFYCLDESPQRFIQLADMLGGVKELYDKYFETMLKSIKVVLGPYKPKRIAHPTLIRIFNKKVPYNYTNKALLEKVMKELKQRNYEIDYNMAGLRKPYCGETYPSGIFLELADKYTIPKVYGSDAHCVNHLGMGYYE